MALNKAINFTHREIKFIQHAATFPPSEFAFILYCLYVYASQTVLLNVTIFELYYNRLFKICQIETKK